MSAKNKLCKYCGHNDGKHFGDCVRPRPLAEPAGSALLPDLAELTLLACTIRHNASEMRNALDRMDRIADMLEANRARLKAQNPK